jgi:hypothetical protein
MFIGSIAWAQFHETVKLFELKEKNSLTFHFKHETVHIYLLRQCSLKFQIQLSHRILRNLKIKKISSEKCYEMPAQNTGSE